MRFRFALPWRLRPKSGYQSYIEKSDSRVSGLAYRSDIDGLRAVAIIPVVLFHGDVPGFTGGFVGVDVFFVISGFLITTLIVRELDAGTFTLRDFWERRARRILPALIVVLAFTLVATALVFLPQDFRDVGRSIAAQSVFGSNILFWREVGYFAGPADEKPLLHTWSLAVEEQFYLFFPIAMALLARYALKWRHAAIAAAVVLSFGLSVATLTYSQAATFYLLPMRAWELLLGALLVVAPFSWTSVDGRVREVIAAFGLAAIVVAVTQYTNETAFPGAAALLPCLGAAALIWANGQDPTAAGRLLSWRPFVFTGLISYSLYLWHWPIFVLARYVRIEDVLPGAMVGLIALSLLMAYASYRFVETPIRQRRFLRTPRSVATASITCLAGFAGVGLTLAVSDGMPERFEPSVRMMAEGSTDMSNRQNECHDLSIDQMENDEMCWLGPQTQESPRFAVWGDSHALAALPLFDEMATDHNISGLFLSRGGCPPILNTAIKMERDCPGTTASAFAALERHNVQHVVLVGRWSVYALGRTDGSDDLLMVDSDTGDRWNHAKELFRTNFKRTLSRLNALGITVWIMQQVPVQPYDVPHELTIQKMWGWDVLQAGVEVNEHLERQAFVNSVFSDAVGPSVRLADPAQILCAEGDRCLAVREGRPVYIDNNHLSTHGAKLLRPLFVPLFRSMASD